MSITSGLLFIILNLFLPGILFLRLYYSGEFSKQWNTKVPLFQIAFRSFIPGLIIQFIGLFLYNIVDKDFTIYNAYIVFSDLLVKLPQDFGAATTHFIQFKLGVYCGYTIITALIGASLGIVLLQLVRYLKWDIKYKILGKLPLNSYVQS